MTRRYYTSVRLSKREKAEAIDEGKKKKYFKQKHAAYWRQQQEQGKLKAKER